MLMSARTRYAMLAALVFVLVSASVAFADKASVIITAPDSVKKGAEITIKIKVTHSGNNFIHHVDWVKVSLDGKEAKRWEYTWTNTPESGSFEREFKYVVLSPVEVSAEADCNMHGSKGPVKILIKVAE